MTFRRIATIGLAVLLATGLAGTAFSETKAPAAKVNVNTASVQQLEELPGVGPALAQRIVEYRQKSGGFKTTQELLNVKGIGEKSFLKIQPHVMVGEGGTKAPSTR